MDLIAPSTNYSARIILIDDTDFKTRKTGIASGSVTIKYTAAGGTSLSTISDKTSWTEIGEGIYAFTFTGAQIGATADAAFVFVVYGTGFLSYFGKAKTSLTTFTAISAATIAAAVWDRLTSALTTVGSVGKLVVDYLNAAVSSRATQVSVDAVPTASENAAAVWDEALAGHAGVGSTGEALAAAAAGGGGADQREAIAWASFRGGYLLVRAGLTLNGQHDSTGTACRITIYDEDGSVALAEQTDAAADARGMFAFSIASLGGLVNNRNYSIKVDIDTPTGTVSTTRGLPTL